MSYMLLGKGICNYIDFVESVKIQMEQHVELSSEGLTLPSEAVLMR